MAGRASTRLLRRVRAPSPSRDSEAALRHLRNRVWREALVTPAALPAATTPSPILAAGLSRRAGLCLFVPVPQGGCSPSAAAAAAPEALGPPRPVRGGAQKLPSPAGPGARRWAEPGFGALGFDAERPRRSRPPPLRRPPRRHAADALQVFDLKKKNGLQ
ncbi:hypothetical protein NN561_010432 [Cricetulus griseus]